MYLQIHTLLFQPPLVSNGDDGILFVLLPDTLKSKLTTNSIDCMVKVLLYILRPALQLVWNRKYEIVACIGFLDHMMRYMLSIQSMDQTLHQLHRIETEFHP